MHSDLVSPSSLQFHIKKSEALITPASAIERKRTTPAAHDGHPRAVTRIAGNGLVDAPGVFFNSAMHQCHIRFEYCAFAKLIGQVVERRFSFCNYKQSGSVSIQAMHNARPHCSCAGRKLLEVI